MSSDGRDLVRIEGVRPGLVEDDQRTAVAGQVYCGDYEAGMGYMPGTHPARFG
jgi:hypothetical protein